VGPAGLEPATLRLTGDMKLGISLILRHGWQPKSTQKRLRNGQVVFNWYSFCSYALEHPFSGNPQDRG